MDLNGDGVASVIEIAAWFMRNGYIVCRPVRDAEIRLLLQEEKRGLGSLFRFLDKNNNKIIKPDDAHVAFDSLDRNFDKKLDLEEMNRATGQMFVAICVKAAKVDRMGSNTRVV